MEKSFLAYATDFAGESTSVEELYQTLRQIAEAGFSHIHWCHEWDGDYMYSRYEMMQIKDWLDELDLKCKGVHATEGSRRVIDAPSRFHYRYRFQDRRDYTSENEYNRLAGVELIQNRIELASMLHTDAIVLHMQLPYKSFEADEAFKERYYRQVFKSLDELELICREKKVRICLENMVGTPNGHQKEQFDRVFSRYDPEVIGFCFDTGHAAITSEGDPLELATRYQERLYMMHVHDNHGLRSAHCWEDGMAMARCDEHMNPYKGNQDWDRYAEIVAGSPYELPIVIEVSKRDRDAMEFLKESIEMGQRLTEMIKRQR